MSAILICQCIDFQPDLRESFAGYGAFCKRCHNLDPNRKRREKRTRKWIKEKQRDK